MNGVARAGNVGRVNTPRILRPVALLSVVAFVGVAAACGGKVDFVTGSSGTGTGVSASADRILASRTTSCADARRLPTGGRRSTHRESPAASR